MSTNMTRHIFYCTVTISNICSSRHVLRLVFGLGEEGGWLKQAINTLDEKFVPLDLLLFASIIFFKVPIKLLIGTLNFPNLSTRSNTSADC